MLHKSFKSFLSFRGRCRVKKRQHHLMAQLMLCLLGLQFSRRFNANPFRLALLETSTDARAVLYQFGANAELVLCLLSSCCVCSARAVPMLSSRCVCWAHALSAKLRAAGLLLQALSELLFAQHDITVVLRVQPLLHYNSHVNRPLLRILPGLPLA